MRAGLSRAAEWIGPAGIAIAWLVPGVLLVLGSMLSLDVARPDTFWNWVGLAHYAAAIQSAQFGGALQRTATLAAITIPAAFAIGSAVAWALVGVSRRLARAVLAIVLLPLLLPPVTTALAWYFQFNPNYGPIGYAFHSLFGSELLDAEHAFLTIAAVEVWRLAPVFAVIFFVSWGGVEQSLKDTITILRPTHTLTVVGLFFRRFRSVIGLACLLALAMIARAFESSFLITSGGPGALTETVPLLIHRLAFERVQLGSAAAISVLYDVLLIAIFVLLCRRVGVR